MMINASNIEAIADLRLGTLRVSSFLLSLAVGRTVEIIWVMGSLVYVHTSKALNGEDARNGIPLALTGAQLTFTGMLAGLLLFCNKGQHTGRTSNVVFILLACLHATGVHAQYVGYFSLRSASAVQLIRSLEVIFALVVGKYVGLQLSLNAMKVYGLFFMASSALFNQSYGFLWSGSILLVTNFTMPVRNIWTKMILNRAQSDSESHVLHSMLSSLQVVCTLCGVMCLYSSAHVIPNLVSDRVELTTYLLNGISGASYNLCSIHYLCRKVTTVVDHVAFSIAKRLAVLIFAVALDFDVQWIWRTAAMGIGQICYFGAGVNLFRKRANRYVIVLSGMFFVVLLAYRVDIMTLSNWTSANHACAGVHQPYALVPFRAFQECNGAIDHLTCSHLVVASTKQCVTNPLPTLINVRTDFCAIFTSENSAFKSVDICVQLGQDVSALVTRTMTSFHLVSDLAAFEHFIMSGTCASNVAVMHRKFVYSTQAYPLASPPSKGATFSQTPGSDNLGDWLWRYGFTSMMNPYTTVFVKELNQSRIDVLVISEANIFDLINPQRTAEKISGIITMIKRLNRPTVLLGIGIQLDYENVVLAEKRNYALHKEQAQLLLEIKRRLPAGSVLPVRGKVTQRACEGSGFNLCRPLGCPSLMISKENNLGQIISRRFMHLEVAWSKNVRIALSFPAIQADGVRPGSAEECLFRTLLEVFTVYDSYVILQMNYDKRNVKVLCQRWKMTCDLRRLVYFSDVADWTHFLSTFHLVFGARIHGVMAGISAGIPSVIIPTDLRTEELARSMYIPHVLLSELNSTLLDVKIMTRRAFQRAKFDTDFERNRIDAIRSYTGLLSRVGIAPNPSLPVQ